MNLALFSPTRRAHRVLASLSLLAALLPVIGCGAGTDESSGVASRDDALDGPDFGVDYAWARPSPSSLYAEGFRFAARYLSYDTTGKNLSKGEADALINAGLDVVVVWEWNADDALQGYGLGVQHANAADAQARACGMPEGRPIYFAIDFDAQPSQQGAIDAYFDGVASVIGRDRTGVYGGYGPVSRLFDAGKVKWGWQTYAWSYGAWDGRAQVRQIQNGIGPGGGEDKDQSMVADFGQWGHGAPPPPSGGEPTGSTVGFNHDGRLELFGRGADDALWHIWQKSAGGGWSGWASLGGNLTSEPVVVSNADGRLEAFARGTDDALWHTWQDTAGGGWSGWASLGGNLTSDPIAARNHDGRLEVFARGTDGALWHAWQTTSGGGWSGWASLGGNPAGDASVGMNQDGRLEVFARVADGSIHHAWQQTSGGWSGWASLGGNVLGNVAVGRNHDGRLEVFGIGTDHAAWHAWQTTPNGGWSGWASLGGSHAADPTVATNADGRLEVFAQGMDSALHHVWQTTPGGGWSGWSNLGGDMTGVADVASNQDGRLEAFVRDPNGAVSHVWQTTPNGGWSGFASLGGDVQQ
jgi:hypothetical protein